MQPSCILVYVNTLTTAPSLMPCPALITRGNPLVLLPWLLLLSIPEAVPSAPPPFCCSDCKEAQGGGGGGVSECE